LNGGADFVGDGRMDESRRHTQNELMAKLRPDIVVLLEATNFHLDDERRITDLEAATGLEVVRPITTSAFGDGANHSLEAIRPAALKVVRHIPHMAKGAFHHGVFRTVLETTGGQQFLMMGGHLSYISGAARLAESHHLADYGGAFPPWPADHILGLDANGPDGIDSGWLWQRHVPAYLIPRYGRVDRHGTVGRLARLDRGAGRLLARAGWRDPQHYIPVKRVPTTGYWYANEDLPLRLDQARVTGPRIEIVNYLTYSYPEVEKLSDHLPVILDVRVHTHPIEQRPLLRYRWSAFRNRPPRPARRLRGPRPS
jgi:endonuclease/exonuclease/phosphatase family metal-dependent hydrolase